MFSIPYKLLFIVIYFILIFLIINIFYLLENTPVSTPIEPIAYHKLQKFTTAYCMQTNSLKSISTYLSEYFYM